ncbi:MAG: hypothetical protein AAFU79_04535, partial [Myxococcota bacterium]
RNLPIGIPLPRWTEDGVNGAAHASMNDYMPPLGLRPHPEDQAQWRAMSDAYIEDPTDAHLFALIDGLRSMHNDGGYRAAHTTPTGNCRRYQQAGDYLYDLSLRKRRSQMITQHLLRRAVLNRETSLELPLAPLAAYTQGSDVGLNPFWAIAGEHAESICYPSTEAGKLASEAILAAMPPAALAEVPDQDQADGVLTALPRQIAHAWFALGQIYDPGLAMRQGNDQATNKLNYWQRLTFSHDGIHRPFFALHRLALQRHFVEDLQGTRDHPGSTFFLSGPVHPLLDGDRLWLRQIYLVLSGEDPRAGLSHRLIGNAFRAVLLLQKELLEAGEPWDDGGQTRGVTRLLGDVRRWVDELERRIGQSGGQVIAEAFGSDLELYTSDLATLADEVEARLN